MSYGSDAFNGYLGNGHKFGKAVASIGDLDGDATEDLAVGSHGHQGRDRGGVWILFRYADGTVKNSQYITKGTGGFTGQLDSDDFFGLAIACMSDLDGDGVQDLAVGASGDDDGGSGGLITSGLGAVWILFLKRDGSVKSHQKISATQGGFTGLLR